MRSLDPETKIIFWISSALIGFNFADLLLKAIVTTITRTTEKLSTGETQAANRVGSLSLLSVPAGMLLSLTFTEFLYDVRDTYFVNEESAMKACFHKGLFLAILNVMTSVGHYVFNSTPWASSEQSPLTTRTSLWDFIGELFSPRTLTVAIELALTVSAVFFMMMQPEYLTNSFRFTSQDAKIILTYYVMGLAFGCISGPPLLDSLGETTKTSWLALTVCGTASGTMLAGIANDDVSIVLTCVC